MSVKSSAWSEGKAAAIKIRAKILEAARAWFNAHGFIEVQGPMLMPAVGDRTAVLRVDYFSGRAYLTQGLGPYARVLMANLGKIYTIAPAFRAEKIRSHRHLIEYWQIEADIPNCDLDGLTSTQEQMMSFICQRLSEEAKEQLQTVRRETDDLKRVRASFPRLTYDDAIATLKDNGLDIEWGATFEWQHERHLSLRFNQPFFIMEYPVSVETFFYERHPQKPHLTLTSDLYAPEGYGEISTGGQPIVEKQNMQEKMQEESLEPVVQNWYLSLRNDDSIPYSGFALGVERLVQWICRLEHIEGASSFPRLVDTLYP